MSGAIKTMADNGASGPEISDSPGFGMKLTIAGIKQKFPSVINLSTEALSTMLKRNTCTGSDAEGNLIVLDARSEDEYNIGHIQGSRRVDYKDSTANLMSNIPELHSPNSKVTVVCYCSVGYRSSVVAQKIEEYLKQKDMPNRDAVKVYNLEGSIFKWANENRPMVDKNGTETKFAHPYNAVFGKLLKKELRKNAVDAQS